jgi:hypothetical protein
LFFGKEALLINKFLNNDEIFFCNTFATTFNFLYIIYFFIKYKLPINELSDTKSKHKTTINLLIYWCLTPTYNDEIFFCNTFATTFCFIRL